MSEPTRRDGGGDEPNETFVRITNSMVYAELQATRADLRALAQSIHDYPDMKKRVRALELKFYGALAGLLTAIVVIIGGIVR